MRTELPLPVRSSRSIGLRGQLSLLALLAALGGCSNMFSIDEPAFTGSTANQQSIITHQAGAPAYAAAPASGVQVSDLPPPSGAPVSAYAAAPAPAPYTPPRPSAAPTLATMGAPTTLGQQAAVIGGPSGTHVVQPGDTAWNISQRYGISVEQLAAANGGSSTVKLGQTLRIPGGGAAAQPHVQVASVDPQAIQIPAQPAAPAPAPAAGGQLTPVVVTPPPADPTSGVTVQEAAPQQLAALTPATASPAEAAAPQANAAPTGFRWPVRGRVISGFGKKPNGERNDGINLAVPEGSPVKAAEDGTVIYAGNELKSYGNLVLIRHAGGWVSAYAHNSELKVNRGDQVKRGQVISLSGMTGGVTTPQVHFELRKDATPVDPLQHMSES